VRRVSLAALDWLQPPAAHTHWPRVSHAASRQAARNACGWPLEGRRWDEDKTETLFICASVFEFLENLAEC
jgi:hypothetical protein